MVSPARWGLRWSTAASSDELRENVVGFAHPELKRVREQDGKLLEQGIGQGLTVGAGRRGGAAVGDGEDEVDSRRLDAERERWLHGELEDAEARLWTSTSSRKR